MSSSPIECTISFQTLHKICLSQPEKGCVTVRFKFKQNPYFSNDTLTKVYLSVSERSYIDELKITKIGMYLLFSSSVLLLYFAYLY